jgi:hypothetical protein
MNDTQVFQGGCLCGATRYRASVAPVRGVMCHCEMCRKHSGAPALAFVHFPVESFEWVGTQPSFYRSSEFAERSFCPNCGSTLGMREEVLKNRVQVAIGSLDEPQRVSIQDHVWTRSRVAWFDTTDALPRFEKSSTAVVSKAR